MSPPARGQEPHSFMGSIPQEPLSQCTGKNTAPQSLFGGNVLAISKETACQHHVWQPNLCQRLKHRPLVRTCLCSAAPTTVAATCSSHQICSPWEGVCVTVTLSTRSSFGKTFLFPVYCCFPFKGVHMDSEALCDIGFCLLVSG